LAGDPRDHPALSALVELSRDAVKPPSEAQLERGLIEVRERVAEVRSRARSWRRAALAGAAAALLLATGVWGVSVFRNGWAPSGPLAVDRPVTIDRIEGGELLDGGYLSESGHGGVGVFFNEGSSFVLAPGTRGRLRELFKDGARFAIEEGAASFQITPNAARRWSVEAGPFLVTVKGTVFNAAWDPVSERFELSLRRGRVVVNGPVAGGAIPLRAGQHLVIVLPRAETLITEERSPEPPEDQPAPRSRPSEVPAAAPTAKHPATRATVAGATAPLVSSDTAGRRWAELLAAGHWDRILADVDREGSNAVLESASSEDLLALADAARYRRRADLARAALLAQRRRYPGSVRALDALFLLGRVEELSPDGAARAIAFYDDYLERAPRGGYAAEALGRKMILSNGLGGPGKARPIADEYLRRFPSGSYAGSARALGHVP
jgi:hypothetical protein